MIDADALENIPRALPIGYYATSGCACAHPTVSRGHVTLDDVISGEKAPFPVAHAHTLPPSSGSCDVRSLPVAMVLVLMYYILYY
jgi:hypothetical protein